MLKNVQLSWGNLNDDPDLKLASVECCLTLAGPTYSTSGFHKLMGYFLLFIIVCMLGSKEEGYDQVSIQSSTIPDPGHHMRK